MKITISTKKFTNKPTNVGSEFYNVKFETKTINYNDFNAIIEEGYALSCNCRDEVYPYVNYDKALNYRGIQYVLIDIDECKLTYDEIIENMEYLPSFAHTSYSHLSPSKGGKNCYHFYFILNEEIKTIKDYNFYFHKFSKSISKIIDKRVTLPYRLVFTNHISNDNYQLIDNQIVYNIDDLSIMNCDVVDEENADDLSIEVEEESNFQKDMKSLKRSELIERYKDVIDYHRATQIEVEDNVSFINLENIEYYEVFNKLKFDNINKKSVKNKIKIGKRHHQLFLDAIQLKAINSNITLDELVFALIYEVYNFYDNSDNELNNNVIMATAKSVMEGEYTAYQSRKKTKVNRKFFKNFIGKQQEKSGIARRDKKDSEIGEMIDLSLSFEENLQMLKANNIKIEKRRLIDFYNRHNLPILTLKERRNERIIEIYNENSTLSVREIATILKEEGMKVSKSTVATIINEYQLKLELENKKENTTEVEMNDINNNNTNINNILIFNDSSSSLYFNEISKNNTVQNLVVQEYF
jgi:hypothetical protein|nr:MAG TPA: arginine repressor [Siphoviridae sp. ctTYz13]